MNNLTRYRLQKGWSKAELGRRAGLHPSQIGLFEAGRLQPYPVQLEKLGRVLDLPDEERETLLTEVAADG